ncbi:Flavin carrier protein [Salix suchowensis]|nr:Flavin carrier protein [Salix suchowensis]
MPDIEAFAQLTLTQVGTGQVKACVQSTLSNGWSTHQPAVEWATGGIALFAFLFAFWQSIYPDSLAPFRFVELFYLYQTIVSSNFLSINYPSVYRSFGLNFAWAMGLFSSSSSTFQQSVTNMRHLTGGHLDDRSSDTAVGFVNRKLSPYNFPGKSALVIPSSSSHRITTSPWQISARLQPSLPPGTHVDPSSFKQLSSSTNVQTVTSASSNVLQAGVPIYVSSVHIPTANAFTTIFLVSLMVLAITVAIFAVGRVLLIIAQRRNWKSTKLERASTAFPWFVKAWFLRVTAIIFAPIVIFALYQWTLKDSWLAVALAVISFLGVFGAIAFVSFVIIRYAFQNDSASLFSHREYLISYGALFAQYRTSQYPFYSVALAIFFLKAVIVAAVEGHGQTQVILWVIIEAFLVITTLVLRPHQTRGGDVLSTYLAITRLVSAGLFIAFIEGWPWRLYREPIILNTGIQRLWKKSQSVPPSPASASSENSSVLEKGKFGESVTITRSPSSFSLAGRPINPTPEHNIPLDQRVLQPYPSSSTMLTTSEAQSSPRIEHNSVESSTLGSVLPRRWSVTPSTPPISPPMSPPMPTSQSSGSAFTISQVSSSPQSPYSPHLRSTPEHAMLQSDLDEHRSLDRVDTGTTPPSSPRFETLTIEHPSWGVRLPYHGDPLTVHQCYTVTDKFSSTDF